MRSVFTRAVVIAAALAGSAASARADPILPGLYRLHNQLNAPGQPPLSGLRLEELFQVTSGRDVFSLDFDDPRSLMFLEVNEDSTEIFISGVAFGGRDIGDTYANDQYLGLYGLEFFYRVGVSEVPGDDDLCADSSRANFGKLLAPSGVANPLVYLTDHRMGGFSFRFGDDDDDRGRFGFDGIAGWGWLNPLTDGFQVRSDPVDWNFSAEFVVPTPGASMLLGLGAFALAPRSRRDRAARSDA